MKRTQKSRNSHIIQQESARLCADLLTSGATSDIVGDVVSTARTLARQRHDVIVAELRHRGAVRVGELAALLGVSEMTVRRDLSALEHSGALVKVHGGAAAIAEHRAEEPGFEAKAVRNPDEKEAIAGSAAGLVEPGAAIGVTAGTTTWRFAAAIVDVAQLTVVTNSLRVSDAFARSPRPDRTVILVGGLRTPSDALVGPVAVDALAGLHLDLVFMGVHGMSERAGFTTPNLLEAETNRAFVDSTDRLVVIADHTKWGVTGLASIAPLQRAATVVTDASLDRGAISVLSEHADVVVAPMPPARAPSVAS